MAVVDGGALPEYEDKPETDSIYGNDSRARSDEVKHLQAFLTRRGIKTTSGRITELLRLVMKTLGVKTESEIWQHPDMQKISGDDTAEILGTFKPIGPAYSTDLLNNLNIDKTLQLYEQNASAMFGKKFKAIPYQMMDFAKQGTELANVGLVRQLKTDGYDAFAVVINTDVSTGRGKHWLCVYCDLAHKGTKADPIVLEYFNSSGNPPMNELAAWLEASIYEAEKHGLVVVRHDSVRRMLQTSRTECGVWCLMYIRSRLDGKGPNYFYDAGTTCDDITAIRKLFFRDD